MILKGAGVPFHSPFIEFARRNHILVEMDASLFARLAPEGVTLVGVTGTRGKSTTTVLIYEILKAAGKTVHLAGNIKDKATLPLLSIVKEGDYVVLELDSWQLQGFGDAMFSPQVAVFTTFYPDHMNYYRGDMDRYFADKANIFRFKIHDSRFKNKSEENILISGEQVLPFIQNYSPDDAKRALVARAADVPKLWQIKLPGEHNLLNIACAIKAARALKIDVPTIKRAVENFGGVEGRLQFVREVDAVKIYNDNNATTPQATMAALKALNDGSKNIMLIMGGADKNLDMTTLAEEIPKYCRALVLLPGTGTDRLPKPRMKNVTEAKTLKEAVNKAMDEAEGGDIVLFSPAFASFGLFKNEYDRGEQFMKIANSL